MAGYSVKYGQVSNSRQRGSRWEKAAEAFLISQGLNLLQKNFSSRFGEIDLIMQDGKDIVFVEVKYRKSDQHGSGLDAITFHKQSRISRTAAWYLLKNPQLADQFCRFDVISIQPKGAEQDINWIKGAFYSTLG